VSSAESETVLTTSLGQSTLSTTLDILQCASHEAKLHLGADGLDTAVVDPANVMMVVVDLAPRAFELTPGGSYTVGSDLQSIEEYTSKAGSGQSVDFSFEPKTRKLNVTYANVDLDVACIDPDTIRREPNIPDLEHPNTVTVDTSELVDALELCNMMADYVGFRCNPDERTVTVYAEGDTDDVAVDFGHEDTANPTKIDAETESLFSADYLIDGTDSYAALFKSIPSDEVTMHLGGEMPIVIEFEYADGAGDVTALVAPRIKN